MLLSVIILWYIILELTHFCIMGQHMVPSDKTRIIHESAEMTIILQEYININDKLNTGLRCDSFLPFMPDYCDPQFTLTVQFVDSIMKNNLERVSGIYNNQQIIKHVLNARTNLEIFPEKIIIIISIDDIDIMKKEKIADFVHEFEPSAPMSSNINFGNQIKLNLLITIRCLQDLYGSKCDVSCKADPPFWECNNITGEQVCVVDCGNGNCSKQGGNTVCLCNPGWHGFQCKIKDVPIKTNYSHLQQTIPVLTQIDAEKTKNSKNPLTLLLIIVAVMAIFLLCCTGLILIFSLKKSCQRTNLKRNSLKAQITKEATNAIYFEDEYLSISPPNNTAGFFALTRHQATYPSLPTPTMSDDTSAVISTLRKDIVYYRRSRGHELVDPGKTSSAIQNVKEGSYSSEHSEYEDMDNLIPQHDEYEVILDN